ncbi:hypothetical protein LTR95_010508 [Oleoguttula sp. CCFEE 5521]
MTSPSVILVAGEVTHEHLIYPMATGGEDARVVVRSGGAELIASLLAAVAPEYGFEVLGPVAQSNGVSCYKSTASALVDLEPRRASPSTTTTGAGRGELAYSVTGLRRLGQSPAWQAPSIDLATKANPETIIITGSGDTLHNVEQAVDLLQRVKPKYIVHHMTRPLATGKLWDVIRSWPNSNSSIPDPDNLVVIVEADDLRAEGINLSQSLSWEATAEDFVRNLGSNGRLDTLVTCPNLIVRFGTEGVIHHRGRDAVNPRLYFDPRRMEGEVATNGTAMLGLAPAFTAGFALGFAGEHGPDADRGVRYGISTARNVERTGFVQSSDDRAPDYPISQAMSNLTADNNFTSASIPSARISSMERETWQLFSSLTGDPQETARQVVTLGPHKALSRCPIRQFGNLLSIERTEQERLAAVMDIAEERVAANETQPTCIGIFGPAGSGKKYTATNLAEHLGRDRKVTTLTFDGRILKDEYFTAACHTIRDASATGTLPIVIFQNCAILFELDNPLVNPLLTLMSNGTYVDGAAERHLGHAILLFLMDQEQTDLETTPTPVATTNEFALRRRPTTPSAAEWKALESNDSPLMDSLHGIVNVAGPNSTGRDDKMFTVRRALMLRQIIKQKYPHMEINGVINIDDAVLHALLLTPHFKHGLGSLEKIIGSSRLSNRTKFDVSALPPEEQIQLHADGKIFMSFLRAPKLPPALRERLAQGLFEAYKKQRELMAATAEERKALHSDRSYCDWDDLSGELKESTRAQADDIPRKLRATGCFMLEDTEHEPRGEPLVHVPQFGGEELLMLSEMEHERFNAERLQRQWRMGARNSKQRTTPFLVPWRDLTQEWKDVDTVMVKCVPGILESAGWRIYRMQS